MWQMAVKEADTVKYRPARDNGDSSLDSQEVDGHDHLDEHSGNTC